MSVYPFFIWLVFNHYFVWWNKIRRRNQCYQTVESDPFNIIIRLIYFFIFFYYYWSVLLLNTSAVHQFILFYLNIWNKHLAFSSVYICVHSMAPTTKRTTDIQHSNFEWMVTSVSWSVSWLKIRTVYYHLNEKLKCFKKDFRKLDFVIVIEWDLNVYAWKPISIEALNALFLRKFS